MRERITAYVNTELVDDIESLIYSMRRHGVRTNKSDLVSACLRVAISEYGKLGENAAVLVQLRNGDDHQEK